MTSEPNANIEFSSMIQGLLIHTSPHLSSKKVDIHGGGVGGVGVAGRPGGVCVFGFPCMFGHFSYFFIHCFSLSCSTGWRKGVFLFCLVNCSCKMASCKMASSQHLWRHMGAFL